MIYQKDIQLPPFSRGFHLITDIISSELEFIPDAGLLNIFIKHTSAALSLNENADSTVRFDFETFMNELVPDSHQLYSHTSEGEDDMPAHIKSSLFGASLNIPVKNGKMNLGIWQGIYLCEFRNNGGRRHITLTIIY
jgi:secondary thiamine-phosphate synthase enzyme